jgi:Leucine-rich repeat (LRR) protein
MTNQLNPVQTQPLSLLSQTVSFIITRNLQNSIMANDVRASTSFTRAWLDLKHSPQNFSLEHIMSNIEKSFVKDEQRSRNITFSQEQVNDVLEKNKDILFKKLAEKFQAKRIFGSSIPVDISSYERLQRAWEDEALQTIWDARLARQFVFNGPAPTSLNEIRAWLKNPANAMQLNGVQTLDLSQLGLKAIPSEISALTQLQCLSLDYNQISSIPDSLGSLSQLQRLFLDHNQISCIPDSLGNLSQLQLLNLENNQVSIIPDSLGKLSQLQTLRLNNNQISRIPDSLGNLSQLQRLFLAGNQIKNIPDSLSKLSQLERLHLENNQIVAIPDSLSNLPQLRFLLLEGNPLLFIPDKGFASSPIKLIAACSEFKNYKCLSPFSILCQLMVQKSDDHEMIKKAFENLEMSDQNLIFAMVHQRSGGYFDNPNWKKHQVFDDMNIFYHAVKQAIAVKFDRLSLEKNAVYEEIHQLAQPETKDPKWGEQHAFDNVLRLIDAMDRVTYKQFASEIVWQ